MTETEYKLAPNGKQLVRTLQSVFRAQARNLLTERSLSQMLDGTKPLDLSYWLPTMVEQIRPFLLRDWTTGMIRSQHQILQMLRSRSNATLSMSGVQSRVSSKTYRPAYALQRMHREPSISRLQSCSSTTYFSKAPIVAKAIGVRWDLFNPRVLSVVDSLVLRFCEATNNTAIDELSKAIERLRTGLGVGLARGEAISALHRRVMRIFTDPVRAFRIAITESSRAMNGGELMSAKESGVVGKKRWLCSSDACDACLDLWGKEVELDEPFYVDPKGGPYAIVMHPPKHPNCFCTWTGVLKPTKEVDPTFLANQRFNKPLTPDQALQQWLLNRRRSSGGFQNQN